MYISGELVKQIVAFLQPIHLLKRERAIFTLFIIVWKYFQDVVSEKSRMQYSVTLFTRKARIKIMRISIIS